MEKYFPEHNVRYIAILDNIDTISDNAGNDIAPYRAILNDQYAKDISKKVRSSVYTKKSNGEFLGWKAVYGYKKDEKNKNNLHIRSCVQQQRNPYRNDESRNECCTI